VVPPPSIWVGGSPKALPPPRILKKFPREAMSHELTIPKRREFRLELAESWYIAGMGQHPDTWTAEGVKGGLEPGRPPRGPPLIGGPKS
jgi:hypothetical protein